jgi:two-component system response regulator (stage 0 sporulation protein F)
MGHILIVDDQKCVRQLLSAELMLAGFQVAGVADPPTAKEHLSSCQTDLVLLDLYLDGYQEFELLAEIKREHPNLPVIILTACDSFMDDPRLSHADAYVIKSIHFDELKQRIAQVLMHQPALQTTEEADSRYPRFAVANRF